MKDLISWLLITMTLILPSAQGAELMPFFRTVRAQAMGGASVATVNDENSLFLNPAGLGKIRSAYFALINPELEANFDANDAIVNSKEFSALTNPQQLLDLARRYPDKVLHTHAQFLPAFVTTNFGIGLYGNYSINGELVSTTNTFNYQYLNDYGAVMGYCFRLFNGRIKFGISGKIVNRVHVDDSFPSTSTDLSLTDMVSEGTGAGVDAGLILTAPWTFLPTISAAVHDVGNTKFNLGSGYFFKTGRTPSPQQQSIDVAAAIFPIHNKSTRSTFTVEWRDIQNPESQDFYRRIHAGFELNFSDILFLRAGMNQRYYTAGLELVIGRQQIQIATYGEEIGTPTNNREDRRFIGQFGFRF